MKMTEKIQAKWQAGYVVGYDGIVYGDGKVVMANAYSTYDPNNGKTQLYWSPLCDTTLASIESYNDDVWVEVDIFHGSFEFEGQTIVFGDGGMGNEGYVASITKDNKLNWSLFSTVSNPIMKAEMQGRTLICYGQTGYVAKISIDDLTQVSVTHRDHI